MATRPSQDFEWATSGLKTDPGAGKKDVGFLTAEKPPARWFNYLLNLAAQWLGYLDESFNTDLIEALGGTANTDQIPDLIAQGTFTPILAATPSPGFTYTVQNGIYQRIGNLVATAFEIEWNNGDDAQNTNTAIIVPPFDPVTGRTWVGALDYHASNFGTAGANITTATLCLSAALGGICARGRATTMNSLATSLAYGDSNTRKVVGSISYLTDGSFNY